MSSTMRGFLALHSQASPRSAPASWSVRRWCRQCWTASCWPWGACLVWAPTSVLVRMHSHAHGLLYCTLSLICHHSIDDCLRHRPPLNHPALSFYTNFTIAAVAFNCIFLCAQHPILTPVFRAVSASSTFTGAGSGGSSYLGAAADRGGAGGGGVQAAGSSSTSIPTTSLTEDSVVVARKVYMGLRTQDV